MSGGEVVVVVVVAVAVVVVVLGLLRKGLGPNLSGRLDPQQWQHWSAPPPCPRASAALAGSFSVSFWESESMWGRLGDDPMEDAGRRGAV